MTSPELIGAWVSIFLTLCIFSYLYGDNPVYKFAEHLFLGVSIGVAVLQQFFGAVTQNLLNYLLVDDFADFQAVKLIPLVLVLLLFMKVAGRQVSWLARIPIAFIVAAYAGVKMTGEADGNLMRQTRESMPDVVATYNGDLTGDYQAIRGLFEITDGILPNEALFRSFLVFSDLFLLLGLIACLLHFYFSAPHSRPMKVVSRFGVLVLMVSFGASFGYTVMGRISLAIGRMQELLGYDRPEAEVAAIHPQVATAVSLVIIIAILAAWRVRGGGDEEPAPS